MKRGRPPQTRAATAYDYRRSIFIVQILARIDCEGWHSELLLLADDWQVEHDGTFEDCLKQLARHTLEHGKNNYLE